MALRQDTLDKYILPRVRATTTAVQTHQYGAELRPPKRRTFIVADAPDRSRQQAFFCSTGTSNACGFPGTFFPTAGVRDNWIHKYGGHTPDFAWELEKQTESTIPKARRYAYTDLLDLYFASWWQVQISASLGGEWWERPDMAFLRGMAQWYDFDETRKTFVLRDTPFPLYRLTAMQPDIHLRDVNDWYRRHQRPPPSPPQSP